MLLHASTQTILSLTSRSLHMLFLLPQMLFPSLHLADWFTFKSQLQSHLFKEAPFDDVPSCS